MALTKRQWGILRNLLRYFGFVGLLADWIFYLGLIAYYSATRPHEPIGEWNTRLHWSIGPPSYGTLGEDAFLQSVFRTMFVFFMIVALSEAIRIYKLERS